MKQTYTPEYIEYVQKHPYTVKEDFKNGIKNELVFESKEEAEAYITRARAKSHKRATFTLIKNELLPEYMPIRRNH